ncbi:MAG: T9SS type A sorting domain-containing protein [Flavobacteriales bacterium]|nr:MAG: T9SS type A sorting domain-containing protein [Flavobacteriales bacterium]
MNKKLYLILYLLLATATLWAQTTVTATWSLLANQTGVVSPANAVTLANQTISSSVVGIQYNSGFTLGTGFQRAGTTTPGIANGYSAGSYIEYTLSVPIGKKLTLTNISFSALGGGTGSARALVQYSLDGFLTPVSAGAASYAGVTYGNTNATDVNSAIVLLNTSATTGSPVVNISPSSVVIGQNKTLSVRIYVWAGSAGRYFASKDFTISGTLEDDNTPVITQYPLTTNVSPVGSGTVTRTPNATDYDENSQVSLTANPNFGFRFSKWVDANNGDGELSTANPYVVTMAAAKSIKAVFEARATYSFNVAVVGSSWGEVKLTPQPTGGKYEAGTEVTVEVVPNPVVTFSKWEDNSNVSQRVIVVNSDQALTATFDEIPFIVGWNFKDQNIKTSKVGDYYAESTNTGTISTFEPNGTAVNWLSNPGAFSPSYPNVRLWTAAANFATTRRYLQAQLSTTGYRNIQVKSMVSANYQAYKIMTLKYSTDGTNFTEVARVDIADVYGAAWKDLNVTLPVGAENQTRIYLRWVADETSGLLSENNDNDGTAFTNIYVYADKEVVNDADAPLLISTVPASASNTATINGSVVLTFNERVKVGAGNITLGAKTLTGVYGSKTVTFPYEKLSYNTAYTVTVPTGALTDMSGNAYAGTTFTFTTGSRTEPTKKLYDAVVAKDGSGNYTSVVDAIAAAPANRTTPWIIFVKNGTYLGHHDIPVGKPFIHLIGQSRDGVIISDSRLSGSDGLGTTVYHVSEGATMVVNSANCYFENITFDNSKGFNNLVGPQALALYTIGDKFAMNNSYLRSYQDTYLTSYNSLNARHYILKSKIEGAVDFIYGGADVFFDKDTLAINRSAGGYLVAPSHAVGTTYGYVFNENVIVRANKVNTSNNAAGIVDGNTVDVATYLGRPWQNAPKTVFLNTKLGSNLTIYPQGWFYKFGAIPAVFADYGTVNSNGQPVDVSQRISNYEYDTKDVNGNVNGTVTGTAKSSLTDTEAAAYTYENVILRSGDTWDPRMIAEAPDKPANLALANNKLTWDAVAYTRLYVITRDNVVVGFSLTNEFTDNSAVQGTNYAYKVQAASEYGALSLASDVVQVLPITGLTFNAKKVGQMAALSWSTVTETNTSHFDVQRSVDGKTFKSIGRRDAAGESVAAKSYTYTDFSPFSGYNYYKVVAVDRDAKFTESEVQSLRFDLATENVSVYPNPTSVYQVDVALSLANAGKVRLKLSALDGRTVQTELQEWPQGNGKKQFKINRQIATGVYILHINGAGINEAVKLIVK